MEKRYIPFGEFTLGRGRVFHTRRVRDDGTIGYTLDELKGLSKKTIANHFRIIQVDLATGVEQATAAPGETRKTTRKAPAKKTAK